MRKIFLVLVILIPFLSFSQAMNRLIPGQAGFQSLTPDNFIFIDVVDNNKCYPAKFIDVSFLNTTTQTNCDLRYVPLTRTINGYSLASNITLTKGDVGLGNVDNTSDISKPVSTAQAIAIATKFNIPTGSPGEYLNGNGTPTTFPTIPTNTNQLINGAGFINSVPAQSFSSLTGKPTTLAGYAITDAYPLTGNPGGFLTGITSGQIATALGYTPTNPNGTNLQYTAGDGSKITFPTIPAPQVQSDWNAVSGLGVILNKPAISTPTINSAVSRSLNSNFTVSTTKQAKVTYTVRIAYNVTVLLGSTGTIDLQYSTNAGSSWITVSSVSNSLNLGLALTGYNDFVLVGDIPANALVRLNSATTNATNTYRTGQETY